MMGANEMMNDNNNRIITNNETLTTKGINDCTGRYSYHHTNGSNYDHHQYDDDDDKQELYELLLQKFASKPKQKTLFELCSNTLVVTQEIALSTYFLACHQIAILTQQQHGEGNNNNSWNPSWNIYRIHIFSRNTVDINLFELSTILIIITLLIIFYYSSIADQRQQLNRMTKLRHRSLDTILLALLLRFIISILQSLTASYSSDTVELLAFGCIIVHVVFCDYSYANGSATTTASTTNNNTMNNNTTRNKKNERQPYLGGTVSLNAALFATTLLVSRLQSSSTNNSDYNYNIFISFMFMILAIIIFAFYPITRHAITTSYPSYSSAAMWIITTFICLATILLLIPLDTIRIASNNNGNSNKGLGFAQFPYVTSFQCIIMCIGLIIPIWKLYIQRYKIHYQGPWDIPSVSSMQLNYKIYKAKPSE